MTTQRKLREFTIEATVTRVYRQTVKVDVQIRAITAMAAHESAPGAIPAREDETDGTPNDRPLPRL